MEIKVQDYEKMSKEELVYILKNLKYGLIWSVNENTKEQFEKESGNAYPVLKGVPERDILTDKEKPTNLLIEGDNYHVLSVMQYTHRNSIDVIYIDPPYNTGNKDFVYNDRFVDKEDTWRHSKWLSFMSKRLKLARELLKDDGVIFISIDDNEFAQLKLLCDEIFGEDNFVANIIYKKGGGKSDSKYLSIKYEYILTYRKTPQTIFKKAKSPIKNYKLIDEQGRRYCLRGFDMQGLNYTPSLDYPIEAPDGTLIYPGKSEELYFKRQQGHYQKKDWCWTLSKKEFEKRKSEGNIVFKKIKGEWRVYYKSYYKDKVTPFENFIDFTSNQASAKEIKNLFNNKKVFEYAKPVDLIKHLINLHANNDAIVLDFFAGSGTTGHAVLELNKEDGGNRQFILVTNNENNICTDVCYPRIKKVIEGYTTPKGKKIEGLGGNLKYYKTDFVPKNANTDQLMNDLVKKCTDILCIKENTFDLVSDTRPYKIFKSPQKVMAVYTSVPSYANFQKLNDELARFDGKKILYCFTFNPLGIDEEHLEMLNILKDVEVEPIPHQLKNMLDEALKKG